MGNKNKAVAVTVVNLETGHKKDFPSIGKAAAWMCISTCTAQKMLVSRRAYQKWFVFRQGQDKDVEATITTLKSIYKKNGPIRRARHNEDDLVSLRIDRNTVIMVPKWKATPEYAEQWRQRYLADSNRIRERHEFVDLNDSICLKAK